MLLLQSVWFDYTLCLSFLFDPLNRRCALFSVLYNPIHYPKRLHVLARYFYQNIQGEMFFKSEIYILPTHDYNRSPY